MPAETVGFVGLGNMGSALASNLVASGHHVVAYDVVGSGRCPEKAVFAPSVQEMPDGRRSSCSAFPTGTHPRRWHVDAQTAGRRTGHVVDTSTIGVAAARTIDELLAAAGVGYVDVAGLGRGGGGPSQDACRSCSPGPMPSVRRSRGCFRG